VTRWLIVDDHVERRPAIVPYLTDRDSDKVSARNNGSPGGLSHVPVAAVPDVTFGESVSEKDGQFERRFPRREKGSEMQLVRQGPIGSEVVLVDDVS
jgi:hypothetical protein